MVPAFLQSLPVAVTVCDLEGIIVYMNDRSVETFAADGGAALIGTNLLECHPEPSRTRVAEMLASGETNAYTIEKAGRRKLIYQSPWYVDGVRAGIVELSLVIPGEMPHFIRQS